MTRTVRALAAGSFAITTACPVPNVLISFGWMIGRSTRRRSVKA